MDKNTLRPGSVLQNGKYSIKMVLGQGGFGITYLGEQTGLGMRVAIKEFFLKGSCSRDLSTSCVKVPVDDNKDLVTRCLKKFKAEARKIASLNNDHIINIIDVFDENGTSYYVMKYLGGGSLSTKLQSGPLSEQESIKVVQDISDALRSVHNKGLLHLDIKPANILYDERGRAVLIDFGISKYLDSAEDSTTTSSLIGFSRGYAPLEQVNSTLNSLSPATDIYALGATLYSVLTGEAPPEASVVMDSGLPPMPDTVSEDLQKAVEKAMQPRRKDRPQTIDDFLDLLPKETAEPEVTIIRVPTPEPEPLPEPPEPVPPSRLPLILSGLMLAGAIVLMLVTFMGKNGKGGSSDTKALTEEVERLKAENSSLQSDNANLKKRSGQSSSLQNQLQEKENQINSLNRKVQSLQNENATLKSQVNSYKPDAERWRRQLEVGK